MIKIIGFATTNMQKFCTQKMINGILVELLQLLHMKNNRNRIVRLSGVLDRNRHRHVVVLRWAWLSHGHVMLLVNILRDLNAKS